MPKNERNFPQKHEFKLNPAKHQNALLNNFNFLSKIQKI